MWLDRFSNSPAPTASPPSPSRSSFQQQRRSSQQGLAVPSRPGFSPRLSSLNVSKFNSSTASLNSPRLLPNGSHLKQELVAPLDTSDTLAVLDDILSKAFGGLDGDEDRASATDTHAKPDELVDDIDFDGLTLQDFAQKDVGEGPKQPSRTTTESTDYDHDETKLEDLHKSIQACDEVLKSVETSLSNFQHDLGTVSAEIETLQNRSISLNTKLNNRNVVEKLLGPAVEDIAVAPAVIKTLVEGPIDHEWADALRVLDKRSRALETKKTHSDILAISDIQPLLNDLTNLAIERIRDYIVLQIKSLRSPNINAQIIQQQKFLAYKDLYAFMKRHQPQLAEEIGSAYGNTMRWYYLSHFTRYRQALEKMPLYTVDTTDALGIDRAAQRNTPTTHSPSPLSLNRRNDILVRQTHDALPSHIAEDTKSSSYLETPFHAFSTAIVDNASFEYAFLTSFFAPASFSVTNQQFATIFGPTFALGQSYTKQLIENTFDCLGLLLCVRIVQHLAFQLQRRRCPVADGYINGTNMLLWPRFQNAMDAHVESVKRAASALPSSSARATLSLGGGKDDGKSSTAPHMLTQRFGQFLQGVLALSDASASSPASSSAPTEQAADTTPISRSLDRLRIEVEAFLDKASKGLAQAKRQRFLANNYSLILTIIGEAGGVGGMAGEMRAHFEQMRDGS